MDYATHAAYDLPMQWQTQTFILVLEAEGYAAYVADRKITSIYCSSLLEQWHEAKAKQYLLQRHGITDTALGMIYWQALRYALKKLSPHRRDTAVKVIHRDTSPLRINSFTRVGLR